MGLYSHAQGEEEKNMGFLDTCTMEMSFFIYMISLGMNEYF